MGRANAWQVHAKRCCLLINPGLSLSGRQSEVIGVQAALTSPSSLGLNLLKMVQLLSIKELGDGHESKCMQQPAPPSVSSTLPGRILS